MQTLKRNILLIMERDNFEKDAHFIETLANALLATGHEILWYNPKGVGGSRILDPHGTLARLPSWMRRTLKSFILLGYPERWKYYGTMRAFREQTIDGRCENLKRFIKKLNGANVTVLSRSAGGRISSLVADEVGIQKLICIGYPFKHPDHDIEPERYEHLENLTTPFLIIQGARDEYGGTEVSHLYATSPSISLEFFDADHDFDVTPSQWNAVTRRIKNFISG